VNVTAERPVDAEALRSETADVDIAAALGGGVRVPLESARFVL